MTQAPPITSEIPVIDEGPASAAPEAGLMGRLVDKVAYVFAAGIVVAAGILLFIQGIAQIMRCIMCIREGYWRGADDDIEETEELLMKQHVAKDN